MREYIGKIKESAPSYGSIPFWSWNDRLEPDELRRQIGVMKSLGMSGFFMHARGGLETEYLSDEWFRCISACVDEAERLGMKAWAYDENGWPSGFAGGELLKDKANFAVAIEMREGAYPCGDGDVIAVYEKNPDGTFSQIISDGGADNYLILYKRYDGSYVDTLRADVADKFISATYEEYKRRIPADKFGKNLPMPGFFTDEPQYYRWGNPYSDSLPDEFYKAYGYEIYGGLPAIFFDFEGADKFRYDYYYLLHRLFINNFIRRVYAWCEKNGVALTGHAVEESSLGGQMMCSGGVMPFYQYETIPGVDYLGRTILDDISFRQLSSVCAQTGKTRRISEMFACCGWDVSPAELKRIAEVQYAGGVNMMCQHLYPYSERGQRKRDYPLHYSEHNPWQKHLAEFDEYFRNLGAALSCGEEYAPVLVIHPIHGAYCKYRKLDCAPDGGNQSSIKYIDDNFFLLSRKLARYQVPYHYGDEWMIATMAHTEGGKITVGKCTYSAVIIPYTYSLDGTTAALLKKYVADGGRIYLYNGVPPYVDGRDAAGELDFLKSDMTFDDILALRTSVAEKDGQHVKNLRRITKTTPAGQLVYIANIGEEDIDGVTVTLPGKRWAELDIMTLELLPLPLRERGEDSEVTLSFCDGVNHLLAEVTEDEFRSLGAPDVKKHADGVIPLPDTLSLNVLPENVITLDTASLSYDGVNYDLPLSVTGIKDNLLREHYDGEVYLRFTYTADELPRTLRLVAEPMYEAVFVNGTEVHPTHDKWWFDRSFTGADITDLSRVGENEIVFRIRHHQRQWVYDVLYGGVSESLRNCLVFDVEIENIYLVGDFSVRCDGEFTSGERNSTLFDGKFLLERQKTIVSSCDVVKDGYPFYGGELDTGFTYEYHAGDPTVLALRGRFATAEIYVNGAYAGIMLYNRTLDLKNHLTEGENMLRVVMCNSMRNTMGPHHRSDPEPYALGPQTFSFEGEWRGRECADYRARYAFVKYGIKS